MEFNAWVRYLLPWWPGLPYIGRLFEADCLIALALGRNGYPEDELGQVTRVRPELGSDRAAISRLRALHFDPGEPNRQIAEDVERLVGGQHWIGTILQWEVAVACDEFGKLWDNDVVILWPPEHGYFSTERVLRQACQAMTARGWQRPLLVAHRWHIARAFLVLRKLLGRSPIVVPPLAEAFDAKSVQDWTRDPGHWLVHEATARLHHLVHRTVW